MSFTPHKSLANFVPGISVYNHSSPASVVFNDILYLFYFGSGNDGIWYTTTSDGATWTPIQNVWNSVKNMYIAPNTSPCTVVYQSKIYLFYNGAGNDGTWCTTFDGTVWSPSAFPILEKIGGMGFLHSTSPSAAVFENKLYLFWNGCAEDGIWFTYLDGTTWVPQISCNVAIAGLSLAKGTSPYVTTFNGSLFLFWNGSGNDGTWYAALTSGAWGPIRSLNAQITGQKPFLSGTSPTALVLADDFLMRLFWVGLDGATVGFWYSDFNGESWASQRNIQSDIGIQGILPRSSPCTVGFHLTPYIFWVGNGQDLAFSSGPTYNLGGTDWLGVGDCFRLGKSFTVTSSNPALAKFLNEGLGRGMSIPPAGMADIAPQVVTKTSWKRDEPASLGIVSELDRFVYVFGASAHRQVHVTAQIVSIDAGHGWVGVRIQPVS